jgi:hypothetical protein
MSNGSVKGRAARNAADRPRSSFSTARQEQCILRRPDTGPAGLSLLDFLPKSRGTDGKHLETSWLSVFCDESDNGLHMEFSEYNNGPISVSLSSAYGRPALDVETSGTRDQGMKDGQCCKYRAPLLGAILASAVILAINAWVVTRIAG